MTNFKDLQEWLAKHHPLGHKKSEEIQARSLYGLWTVSPLPSVDRFVEEAGLGHLPKKEVIRLLKPPPQPPVPTATNPNPIDPREYRGGLSGKVKEAMARKSVKLYTITQLQAIAKHIKEMQSSLGLITSEEIEPRIHAFPRREGEKTYPIELTLLTEQHMRRFMIDEQGSTLWEQRYDCEQTYDTYGSLTEGDDIEPGEE